MDREALARLQEGQVRRWQGRDVQVFREKKDVCAAAAVNGGGRE